MGKKNRAMRLEFPKHVEQKSQPNRKNEQPGPSGGSGPVSSHGSKSDLTDIDLEHDSGDLAILIRKVSDEASLAKALESWKGAVKFREDLRAQNQSPNYDEFEELRNSRKLDANLKKCTNFVKKIKSFTGSQLDQIEKEFLALNLTKYLGEIATGLADAKLKFSDVNSVIILFSKFHQRYREFASLALDTYKKNLVPKKNEFNPSTLSKLSIDIRIFGELLLCGVFDKSEGFNLVLNAIKNVFVMDKDGGLQFSGPIISFCRGLGYDFAGLVSRNVKDVLKEEGSAGILPPSSIIPTDKKTQMKAVLLEYYNLSCNIVTRGHEDVLSSELRNRKFLKTKGEIPDDRLAAHIELMTAFEKQNAVVKKLSFYLDSPLPILRELPADPEAEKASQLLDVLNDENLGEEGASVSGIQIFDDEELRAFYLDLPDLKVYLPQIAYRENVQKTAAATAAIAEREKELADVDVDLELAMLNAETEGEIPEEEEEAEGPVTLDHEDEKQDEIKPSFQKYLDNLLTCVNSDMVDKSAKEFVDNFNNRPNRKRLIRTLFHIPRQRVDLIPLWSRLVAVLAPVMPEVQLELCQMLLSEFKRWLRKKDPIFIESKLKFTRFIGELVNFGLFPKADAFKCFKLLLLEFVHHQIEMACAFLETCGKYLLRNPVSHRRMQIYLDEFMRKKALKSLEPRYAVMVDNAYSFVCPPQQVQVKRKRRPPLFAFIRYKIYDDLNGSNLENTIIKMRSLNWNDKKVVNYFIHIMSEPWNLKAFQYSNCASLLAALVPFHSEVVVPIVDNITEVIFQRIGSVNMRYNDRRIASIIYFGEFYNYKLVGSKEIFGILYALIKEHVYYVDYSFYNPFDPIDNLFRLRLVCTLLKTCGMYYHHGNSKKKLNYFLKYFLRYYLYKKEAPIYTERSRFPHAILELVEDTIAWLRPGWAWPKTFVEACEQVKEMELELMAAHNIKPEDLLPPQAEQGRGDRLGLVTVPTPPFLAPDGRESRTSQNDSPATGRDGDGDYGAVRELHSTPQERYPEPVDMDNIVITEENWEMFKPTAAELADFDAQIEKMSSETRTGRQVKTDIPVPIKATSALKNVQPAEPGKVGFVLLTRKGNKQSFKQIAIDEDSEFVKRINASRQAEEEERKKIKQLTLGIHNIQQEEEAHEAELQITTRIFK